MPSRDKPSPPPTSRPVELPDLLEAIIEKLHGSDMPARMKAEIARDLASVHETEGRLLDAIVGYETAAFFHPRTAVAKPLKRLRSKLP